MKKQFISAVAVLLVSLVSITVVLFFNTNAPAESTTPEHFTYSVVHTYPHDISAFTEGLAYDGGFLYESTGLYGSSTLRRVNLTSGAVLQETWLGEQYFGEGMTLVNDTIVQLTWQEYTGFVYDKTSFELLKNFSYPTEGWGLTFDGTHLIMSDGSNNLNFFDPLTFQQTGQIQVQDNGTAVSNLNELEYINGDLYANIFTQQKIAIINPQTGQVKAWLNLTGLQDLSGFNSEMVPNGIAYDAQTDRLFVTGKDWPHLFEIKLVPAT
jgi:glutaminyl-peptide cyclotransferase